MWRERLHQRGMWVPVSYTNCMPPLPCVIPSLFSFFLLDWDHVCSAKEKVDARGEGALIQHHASYLPQPSNSTYEHMQGIRVHVCAVHVLQTRTHIIQNLSVMPSSRCPLHLQTLASLSPPPPCLLHHHHSQGPGWFRVQQQYMEHLCWSLLANILCTQKSLHTQGCYMAPFCPDSGYAIKCTFGPWTTPDFFFSF